MSGGSNARRQRHASSDGDEPKQLAHLPKRTKRCMNKPWHDEHPMPKKATLEQRIQWHVEHQKNCACREMPTAIQKAVKETKQA